ncbi:MAG: amidohydrolase family protein [Planctomycetota bacterium]
MGRGNVAPAIVEGLRRLEYRGYDSAGVATVKDGALDRLAEADEALGLRGVTLSPSNQGFHPTDSRAMAIFEQCQARSLPLLLHPGGHLSEQSRLEFARPVLLDEVARTFPKLKIVIAQLGQPWVDETCVLLAKHANVLADVSGLLNRNWQAYQALVTAYQFGVSDKLLFGSDFPYTNAAGCIEALYSINQMVKGTNLPTVPREALRGIVERDALALLGLEPSS